MPIPVFPNKKIKFDLPDKRPLCELCPFVGSHAPVGPIRSQRERPSLPSSPSLCEDHGSQPVSPTQLCDRLSQLLRDGFKATTVKGKEKENGKEKKFKILINVTKDVRIAVPTLTPEQHDIMFQNFKSQFSDKAVFLHERFQHSTRVRMQVCVPIVWITDAIIDLFFAPKQHDTSLDSLLAQERVTPLKNFAVGGKYRVLSMVLSWANTSLVFYRGHFLRFLHYSHPESSSGTVHGALCININDPPHLGMQALVHAALFDWLDLSYDMAVSLYFRFVNDCLFVTQEYTGVTHSIAGTQTGHRVTKHNKANLSYF